MKTKWQCRTLVALPGFLFIVAGSVRAEQAAAVQANRKRWEDPAIVERIQKNIEKHRKGDARLEVVDASGKAVSGVQLEVRQTGHRFLFGCNAFVLGQLKTPEENRRYEESFLKLFNQATIPFYWEGTEPAKGELRYEEGGRDMWRRPPPDRFLPWGAKHHLTLKAHPLLWHAYNPPWLPKDAEELRELYRKRFREIASRYAEKLPIFEVVNESQVCPKTYPLFTPDRAYVEWAFRETAPLFPKSCILMINEVTSYNFKAAEQNPYFAQVKALLAAGVRIDGIGLQYHFFRREALDRHMAGGSYDPVKMLDLYEKFAEFNLPLYITEITIPSAGPDGETLQADLVRDHYRLWFSAPTMAGITWWNLGDGTAVKGENEAQGGLMDGELQPKAAYRVLDDLINKEWTTSAKLVADVQGKASFRGFHGTYDVKVTRNGSTQSFAFTLGSKDTGPQKLVLKD
jgi:GH35 family endo-1,4-beta-xylanase